MGKWGGRGGGGRWLGIVVGTTMEWHGLISVYISAGVCIGIGIAWHWHGILAPNFFPFFSFFPFSFPRDTQIPPPPPFFFWGGGGGGAPPFKRKKKKKKKEKKVRNTVCTYPTLRYLSMVFWQPGLRKKKKKKRGREEER